MFRIRLFAFLVGLGCLLFSTVAFARDAATDATSVDPQIQDGIAELAAFIERSLGGRKIPVGIARFSNIGDEARRLRIGEAVSSLLQRELAANQSVQLAEIEDIDRILEQIKLGQLGLIDSESAVQVGKLVGARVMVSGTVMPADRVYQVSLRLNDVATGRTLGAYSVELPRRKMIGLTRDIYNLHQGWHEAPMRSLLIPGWGQFYNQRPGRAIFYMGTTASLFAMAGISAAVADQRLGEYRNAGAEDAERRYAAHSDAVNAANLFLTGAVLLWVINVADAGIAGPSEPEWAVAVGPSEVRFAFRF